MRQAIRLLLLLLVLQQSDDVDVLRANHSTSSGADGQAMIWHTDAVFFYLPIDPEDVNSDIIINGCPYELRFQAVFVNQCGRADWWHTC